MIFSMPALFLLSLIWFFIFFTIRQLLIKRKMFVFLYHAGLFCVFAVMTIGAGGVQNDAYKRLDQFIMLEKNHQLQNAKNNPHQYNGMFQIDLNQFKNSEEFRNYIEQYDARLDRAEAAAVGWLFVLLAEISMMLTSFLYLISNRKNRNKKVPPTSAA